MKRSTLTALALAAVLAGGSAVALGPIVAQAQSQQQTPQQQPQGQRAAFNPARHIEGRIAYLKTELKITDSQAPMFDAVANAMRDNASSMHDAFQSLRGDKSQPQTALSRLETRAKLTQLRADGEAKMLAAFRPLYQAMSPDQQKSADEMFEHHGHGHFFHR